MRDALLSSEAIAGRHSRPNRLTGQPPGQPEVQKRPANARRDVINAEKAWLRPRSSGALTRHVSIIAGYEGGKSGFANAPPGHCDLTGGASRTAGELLLAVATARNVAGW